MKRIENRSNLCIISIDSKEFFNLRDNVIDCLSKVASPNIEENESLLKKALFYISNISSKDVGLLLKTQSFVENVSRIVQMYSKVSLESVSEEIKVFYEIKIELIFRQILTETDGNFDSIILDEDNDEFSSLVLRHLEIVKKNHKMNTTKESDVEMLKRRNAHSNLLLHNILILSVFCNYSDEYQIGEQGDIILEQWDTMSSNKKIQMLVGFWWRISQTGDIDYGGGCIDPGTADFRKYEYIFDQLLNISPDSIPANCAADNSTLLVCSAIALKAREEMGYSGDENIFPPSFRILDFSIQWLNSILKQITQKLKEHKKFPRKNKHIRKEDKTDGLISQAIVPSNGIGIVDSEQSISFTEEYSNESLNVFNIEKEMKSIEQIFSVLIFYCFMGEKHILPHLLNSSEDLKEIFLIAERIATLKQQRLSEAVFQESFFAYPSNSNKTVTDKDAFYSEQYSLWLLQKFARISVMKLCRELFSVSNMLSTARLICPITNKILQDKSITNREKSFSLLNEMADASQRIPSLNHVIQQLPALVPIGAFSCITSALTSIVTDNLYTIFYLAHVFVAARFALSSLLRPEFSNIEFKEPKKYKKGDIQYNINDLKRNNDRGKEIPFNSVLNSPVRCIDKDNYLILESFGLSFDELRSASMGSVSEQMEEQGIEDLLYALPLKLPEDEMDNFDPFQGNDYTDILLYHHLLRTRNMKVYSL